MVVQSDESEVEEAMGKRSTAFVHFFGIGGCDNAIVQ